MAAAGTGGAPVTCRRRYTPVGTAILSVEAGIHELIDLAWNVVYDLLDERGLLGDGLFVEEYTGIHSWLDGATRYTVVHSREVAVLFVDTRPVDAIPFHHDLLGADGPKSFFSFPPG